MEAIPSLLFHFAGEFRDVKKKKLLGLSRHFSLQIHPTLPSLIVGGRGSTGRGCLRGRVFFCFLLPIPVNAAKDLTSQYPSGGTHSNYHRVMWLAGLYESLDQTIVQNPSQIAFQ